VRARVSGGSEEEGEVRKDTRLAGLQAALRIISKPGYAGYAMSWIKDDIRDLIRAERKRKPKKGAAR
jgi:hypothetical protein